MSDQPPLYTLFHRSTFYSHTHACTTLMPPTDYSHSADVHRVFTPLTYNTPRQTEVRQAMNHTPLFSMPCSPVSNDRHGGQWSGLQLTGLYNLAPEGFSPLNFGSAQETSSHTGNHREHEGSILGSGQGADCCHCHVITLLSGSWERWTVAVGSSKSSLGKDKQAPRTLNHRLLLGQGLFPVLSIRWRRGPQHTLNLDLDFAFLTFAKVLTVVSFSSLHPATTSMPLFSTTMALFNLWLDLSSEAGSGIQASGSRALETFGTRHMYVCVQVWPYMYFRKTENTALYVALVQSFKVKMTFLISSYN